MNLKNHVLGKRSQVYQPIILFYSGDTLADETWFLLSCSLQFVGGGMTKTNYAEVNKRTEGKYLIVVTSKQIKRWGGQKVYISEQNRATPPIVIYILVVRERLLKIKICGTSNGMNAVGKNESDRKCRSRLRMTESPRFLMTDWNWDEGHKVIFDGPRVDSSHDLGSIGHSLEVELGEQSWQD